MDIKDFSEEIVPDLLKYASAFCKCGFSSSVTMKYWHEQDFQNLGVEVPEGHRRLILIPVQFLWFKLKFIKFGSIPQQYRQLKYY